MTTKQLFEQIEAGQGLKNLAESYTEIASIKLRQIRDDVQRNTAFFEELTKIYSVIKQIAAKNNLRVNFKTKETISIVLTSNYRFYGSINTKLTDNYYKQIQQYKTDLLVIGRTGQQLLKPMSKMKNATFITLKKDIPNEVELQTLARYLQPYNRVYVYYSQFKSVLVQLPTFKDITQNSPTDNGNNSLSENLNFILEPELAEMLVFFDSQITALLLQEVFLESELSRTASRLIAMDQAQSNATKFIETIHHQLLSGKRSGQNMNLLETINAYATIKKKGGEKINQ